MSFKEFKKTAVALVVSSAIMLSGTAFAGNNAKHGFAKKAPLVEKSCSVVQNKKKLHNRQKTKVHKEGDVFEKDGTLYYWWGGKEIKIISKEGIEKFEDRELHKVKIVAHGKYVYAIAEGGKKVFFFDADNREIYRFFMDPVLRVMNLPFFMSPTLAASDQGVYFTFDGSNIVLFTNIDMIEKGDIDIIYIGNYLNEWYKSLDDAKLTTLHSAKGIMLLVSKALKCPVLISHMHGNKTGCFDMESNEDEKPREEHNADEKHKSE